MSGLRGIYSPLLIAGDCEGTSRYNTSRISHLRAEPREIKINPALDEPNSDSFSVSGRQALGGMSRPIIPKSMEVGQCGYLHISYQF